MKKRKEGAIKGHVPGMKNNMRIPEDKLTYILEWQKTNMSQKSFATLKGIPHQTFNVWVSKYEKYGIEGLKSKTGKCGSGNPYSALYNKKNLSEIEKLRLELVKKEVECERLKKGYSVKGVGQRKEYVTISKKNSK